MTKPDPLDPDVIRGKLLAHSFLETVEPADREIWAYLKHHDVELDDIEAAGPIGRYQVEFTDESFFNLNPYGEAALVHIVHDADAETPVDLVAWSMTAPYRFAVYRGAGAALGMEWLSANECQLWRTPLAWLRAKCRGACVLQPDLAAALTKSAPGPFVAEDITHGRELIRLMPTVFRTKGKLFVPKPQRRRAAA